MFDELFYVKYTAIARVAVSVHHPQSVADKKVVYTTE